MHAIRVRSLSVAFVTSAFTFVLAGCSGSWEPTSQEGPPQEHVGESQAALATCYDNKCDLIYPEAGGCTDGVTVASSPIFNNYGQQVGNIAIRKSAACDAMWGHVTSTANEWLRVDFTRSAPFATTQVQSSTATTGQKSEMLGVDIGATYTAKGYVGNAFGSYPFTSTVVVHD